MHIETHCVHGEIFEHIGKLINVTLDIDTHWTHWDTLGGALWYIGYAFWNVAVPNVIVYVAIDLDDESDDEAE